MSEATLSLNLAVRRSVTNLSSQQYVDNGSANKTVRQLT